MRADVAAEEFGSRAKRGGERPKTSIEALAGSSPASSDARRAVASSPTAADAGTSPEALVFEYDPEYIERKYGPISPTETVFELCNLAVLLQVGMVSCGS